MTSIGTFLLLTVRGDIIRMSNSQTSGDAALDDHKAWFTILVDGSQVTHFMI
jgi:hypothetical protein